jgi:hypothetical protein
LALTERTNSPNALLRSIPFVGILAAPLCLSGAAFAQSSNSDVKFSDEIPLRQEKPEKSHEEPPRGVQEEPVAELAQEEPPYENEEESEEELKYAGMSAERHALEEEKANVGTGGGITLVMIGTGGAATGAFFGLVFLGDGYDGLAHMAFSLGAVGVATLGVGTALLISAQNRQDAIQRKINVLQEAESALIDIRPDVVVAPGFIGAGLSGSF